MRVFASGLAVVGSLFSLPVMAQTTITDARLTTVVGSDALINNQVAQVDSVATVGEQVRTTQARAEMLLNTGSLSRLGIHSTYTVGAECIELVAGKLLVEGPSQVCFGNAVIAVQGTTYVLEVFQQDQARLSVLEGTVLVSDSQQPTTPPVPLAAGEFIDLRRDGGRGSREDISFFGYRQLVTDELFVAFPALPNVRKIRAAYVRLFPDERVPPSIGIPSDRAPSNEKSPQFSSSSSSPSTP
ncbi:MAG: hypothetical protein OHK0012_03560 [Synechococcales cyanobacterium]